MASNSVKGAMWNRLRFAELKPSITALDKTGIIRDLMTYWTMSFNGVTQLVEADNFTLVLLKWLENPFAVDNALGFDVGIDSSQQRIYNQTRVLQFYGSYPHKIIELAKSDLSSEYWGKLSTSAALKGKVAVIGGIGTGAILLDMLGNEVYYIEIQAKHREFAEWRFVLHGYKHGANIAVRNTLASLDELDGVMVECLHPGTLMSVVVAAISKALKPEGIVTLVDNLGLKDMMENFEEAMNNNGFAFDTNCWRRN